MNNDFNISGIDINNLRDLDLMNLGEGEYHEPIDVITPTKIQSDPNNNIINDIIYDYQETRKTQHTMIQYTMQMMPIVAKIALNSDHPKWITAYTDLLNSFNATNEKFLKNQKQMADILKTLKIINSTGDTKEKIPDTDKIASNPKTIIFSGTPSEMLNEIEDVVEQPI